MGRPAESPAERRDEASRERGYTIERFADDLGLTSDQRAAIAPILEDTRSRMRDLSHRVRPEYREIVDSARARIEAVLSPEQVSAYRDLLERERRRDRDGEHVGRDGSAGPDSSATGGEG
jgi:Spy/CpxP family protein refolding chaperone